MPFFRRLRAASLAALVAASAFGVAPATAQEARVLAAAEAPLRMTWESDDPACSGDDVSSRALRMVSPGVVPRPLQARVEVRRDGEQWLVRLQTQSGELSGRRILRAESCSELQQAIALLLAMAMESKGDVLPPEPAPAPPAEPPPAPAPPPPPAIVPAPAEPAPGADRGGDRPSPEHDAGGGGLGGFVRVDGKAGFGLEPGLGLGLGVSAGLRVGDFDVGVSAAHWPATRARSDNRLGYLELSRQDLGLRVCWNLLHAGNFTLAPCVAPELTLFRHETKEVLIPRSGSSGPYPNVAAAIDLRYALVGDSLSLLVSPGVTLDRVRSFEIGLTNRPSADEPPDPDLPTEEFYRTGRFGPRLELGVDARF
jgi:hypothetical protein